MIELSSLTQSVSIRTKAKVDKKMPGKQGTQGAEGKKDAQRGKLASWSD
jgi:hypothetical protein